MRAALPVCLWATVGGSIAQAGETDTLVVSLPPMSSALLSLLEDRLERFDAAHEDLTVALHVAPRSGADDRARLLAVGSPSIDLIVVDSNELAAYSELGWIAPIDELRGQLGGVPEPWRLGGEWGDHLYGVPMAPGLDLIVYRKDLVEAAGLAAPADLSELVFVAKALEKEKKVKQGLYIEPQVLPTFLLAGGGALVTNGRMSLDDPRHRSVIDLLLQAAPPGGFAAARTVKGWSKNRPRGTSVIGALLEGDEVGFLATTEDALFAALRDGAGDRIGVMPIPGLEPGSRVVRERALYATVHASSYHAEAAHRLLRWLLTNAPDPQSPYLPVRRDDLEAAARAFPEGSAGRVAGLISFLQPSPRPRRADEVEPVLIDWLSRIFARELPVDVALARASSALSALSTPLPATEELRPRAYPLMPAGEGSPQTWRWVAVVWAFAGVAGGLLWYFRRRPHSALASLGGQVIGATGLFALVSLATVGGVFVDGQLRALRSALQAEDEALRVTLGEKALVSVRHLALRLSAVDINDKSALSAAIVEARMDPQVVLVQIIGLDGAVKAAWEEGVYRVEGPDQSLLRVQSGIRRPQLHPIPGSVACYSEPGPNCALLRMEAVSPLLQDDRFRGMVRVGVSVAGARTALQETLADQSRRLSVTVAVTAAVGLVLVGLGATLAGMLVRRAFPRRDAPPAERIPADPPEEVAALIETLRQPEAPPPPPSPPPLAPAPEAAAIDGLAVLVVDVLRFGELLRQADLPTLHERFGRYQAAIHAVAQSHGGVVEPGAADRALISFRPGEGAEPTLRASRAAQALRQFAALQDPAWRESGGPGLTLHMGIAVGRAVVGPVGGLARVILGEAPALAARLQALNRTYGTDVLLSGEAAVGLGADCPVRELDRVRVRGKDDVVVVHELLPQPDPVPSPVRYRFARALRFYRGRRWSDALEAMAELAPHDPAAAAFLVRCQRYLRTPPPESWDGVYLDERSA